MTGDTTIKLRSLRTMGRTMAAQLDGSTGGRWEKFFSDSGTGIPADKPGDIDILSRTAIAAHFPKLAAAGVYSAQLVADSDLVGNGTAKAIRGKLESDLMASFHQALALRSTTRIRSVCAAMSRRVSMAAKDVDNFGKTYIDRLT